MQTAFTATKNFKEVQDMIRFEVKFWKGKKWTWRTWVNANNELEAIDKAENSYPYFDEITHITAVAAK